MPGLDRILTIIRYLLSVTLIFNLTGCTSVPEGVKPVNDFDLSRYLGTWYEVARLDHSFERGLENVTATYTLDDDGSVIVLNKGFDTDDGEWTSAKGKAKFVDSDSKGHLKVSFFGPFYSSYVISYLQQSDAGTDNKYQMAYVIGYKSDFVWLLSRTPIVDDADKQRFKEHVAKIGVNTDELIWVNHQPR